MNIYPVLPYSFLWATLTKSWEDTIETTKAYLKTTVVFLRFQVLTVPNAKSPQTLHQCCGEPGGADLHLGSFQTINKKKIRFVATEYSRLLPIFYLLKTHPPILLLSWRQAARCTNQSQRVYITHWYRIKKRVPQLSELRNSLVHLAVSNPVWAFSRCTCPQPMQQVPTCESPWAERSSYRHAMGQLQREVTETHQISSTRPVELHPRKAFYHISCFITRACWHLQCPVWMPTVTATVAEQRREVQLHGNWAFHHVKPPPQRHLSFWHMDTM